MKRKRDNTQVEEKKNNTPKIDTITDAQLQNNIPDANIKIAAKNIQLFARHLYNLLTGADINQQQILVHQVILLDNLHEDLLQNRIKNKSDRYFIPILLSYEYNATLDDGTFVAQEHQNLNGLTIAHSLGLHMICDEFADNIALECDGQFLKRSEGEY